MPSLPMPSSRPSSRPSSPQPFSQPSWQEPSSQPSWPSWPAPSSQLSSPLSSQSPSIHPPSSHSSRKSPRRFGNRPLACFHGVNFYRSEEHTSELQSLMRISYAVFCLKKKKTTHTSNPTYKAITYTYKLHTYRMI